MDSQEEIKITEMDVIGLMNVFSIVSPTILKTVISRNANMVKSFETKIKDYKNQLSDENVVKIKKILEMPTSELQRILNKAYDETNQKQLKILAEPKAKPFIEKNLQELKKVLFL